MISDRRGIYCAVTAGIAFLLLSLVAEVSGKSYYIDAENGSDNNSGTSPSFAWQTLEFASGETLGPGDSLLLKRGCQWMEGFECYSKGSPGRPFYLGAYGSGSAPVINDSTDENGFGIELFDSWVVVESLLVKNGLNGGIFLTQYADSSIVRNCEVTASGTGIEVQGRYDLVRGNYLHDLTMILNEQGNEGDYGAVGITVNSSCNEICYNHMIRCSAPCYEGGADGGVVELYGTTDSCLIHHNLGVACNGFVEVGGGSAINTRLYYNILINCGVGICIHLNDQFASVVQNLRMENNTILDTTTGTTPTYDLIDFVGTPTPSTFIFRNNIVLVKNFSYIVQTANASSGWSFTHSHNLYFLESSAIKLNMPLDSGETQGNPVFVNSADTNLRLASNSPAISDGLSLGYTLDFYNNPVPTIPSLGAVQYKAITTAVAMPTPSVRARPACSIINGLLSYSLDKECPVEIRIFDLLGRKLFELNRIQQSGSYSFSLSNLNLGSELHIVCFKAGNVEQRISVPGRVLGR